MDMILSYVVRSINFYNASCMPGWHYGQSQPLPAWLRRSSVPQPFRPAAVETFDFRQVIVARGRFSAGCCEGSGAGTGSSLLLTSIGTSVFGGRSCSSCIGRTPEVCSAASAASSTVKVKSGWTSGGGI